VILAIETSGERPGLALIESGKVLAERILDPSRQAAGALLPTLEVLLSGVGRALAEIDRIALSCGPGSFTGLRVGLATAMGLCFGTERRVVAVPTLAALSLRASLHGGDRLPVATLLDARRGEVYAGLYGAGAEALRADCVSEPRTFFESLQGIEHVYLLGPGAQLYRDVARDVLGTRATLLDAELGLPSAATVGLLGERLASAGHARPAECIELRYLRRAEAEEKKLQRDLLDTAGRSKYP
jgi:tRNA threonylcarbamoyladenosine biosynthesis protein TsaB